MTLFPLYFNYRTIYRLLRPDVILTQNKDIISCPRNGACPVWDKPILNTAEVWSLSEKFLCFKIRMRLALYCPEWRAVVTRRRYVTAIKDFHLPYLRSRVGGFYFSRVSSERALRDVESAKFSHGSSEGKTTPSDVAKPRWPPGTIDAFKINEDSQLPLNEIT